MPDNEITIKCPGRFWRSGSWSDKDHSAMCRRVNNECDSQRKVLVCQDIGCW